MVELIAPNGGLFEASDEAATALLANGWKRVCAAAPHYTQLTAAELRALCAERGVETPKRATKAQLAALLGN